MIQSTFASVPPVGASASSRAEGLPFGARGSTALGSGLRSGVVLVDAVGRATQELDEVRKALAETQREEIRAEARRQFADEVRARSNPELEQTDSDPADRPDRASGEDTALQAVVAAQLAAVTGDTVARGSFVNLAV